MRDWSPEHFCSRNRVLELFVIFCYIKDFCEEIVYALNVLCITFWRRVPFEYMGSRTKLVSTRSDMCHMAVLSIFELNLSDALEDSLPCNFYLKNSFLHTVKAELCPGMSGVRGSLRPLNMSWRFMVRIRGVCLVVMNRTCQAVLGYRGVPGPPQMARILTVTHQSASSWGAMTHDMPEHSSAFAVTAARRPST